MANVLDGGEGRVESVQFGQVGGKGGAFGGEEGRLVGDATEKGDAAAVLVWKEVIRGVVGVAGRWRDLD